MFSLTTDHVYLVSDSHFMHEAVNNGGSRSKKMGLLEYIAILLSIQKTTFLNHNYFVHGFMDNTKYMTVQNCIAGNF